MFKMGIHRRVGLLAAVVMSGLLVPTTTAVFASPAYAAVPGLQIVTASSANDSFDSKSVTATCPAGTQVLGGGADLINGLGEVIIDDLSLAATTVTATGYEDDNGTANLWTVRAYAVCANPLPGYVIVNTTSAMTSDDKTATAVCPVGTKVVGSGGAITGGSGDVTFEALTPMARSVTAVAYEDDDGTANNWWVEAYAVCANPVPGLQIVSASSATNSVNKTVTVSCPAGTQVLGAGAEVPGGSGEVRLDDLWTAVAAVTATGKEDGNGTANLWSVRAIAVCATP